MTILSNRIAAQASKWTFSIGPIKELIDRYVGNGIGWVDPFAGMNSPAEFTNDHNPDCKASYHMEAADFCKMLVPEPPGFAGVLFDPPYSYRQVSEHYKVLGKKATPLDTSTQFYSRVMNPICDKIRPGGYAISCGWNSNGFGKHRGFELIEVLLVAHGTHHNDTVVVVERKYNGHLTGDGWKMTADVERTIGLQFKPEPVIEDVGCGIKSCQAAAAMSAIQEDT